MPVLFNTVDNAASKLQKIKEFIDNGMGATLDVALDIEERKKDSEQVKELHDTMVQYAQMEREVSQWIDALDKTKVEFNKQSNLSSNDVPDIEAIFDEKLAAVQAKNTKSDLMNHKKVKNFQSQIWKVHHEGQAMPSQSDEAGMDTVDDDVIMSELGHRIVKKVVDPRDEVEWIHNLFDNEMAATVASERTTCPITTVEMKKPMRHKRCGHSYEKYAIYEHIKSRANRGSPKCPIAGCVQYVTLNDLEPNTELEKLINRKNRKK